MAIINNLQAKAIKPDDKPIAHGAVTGLTLVPSKTKGHGYWRFIFTSPETKKRRETSFGTYPEISIAEASKQGMAARELIAKGIDPLAERERTKQEQLNVAAIPSFEAASLILHKELLPSWKNAKHKQQWINTLETYAFPVIGDCSLDSITPALIADVLRPIWLSKPETASRLKQRLHAVIAWGWAHGFCASNPVDVVQHLLPKQESKELRTQHQPAMPWREIPEFIAKDLRNGVGVTRPLLEFLILTATRSGEVRGMLWQEVDIEQAVWVIPESRMKMKISHRIPLSSRAIEIIKAQVGHHAELVFPAPRGGELSDMVLTSFLRKAEARSDTPDRYATAHGFRSSFRDWASENGYARDLAERALAHAIENKTEAAYHRSDLLEQRRAMMQAWCDYVTGRTVISYC